MKKNASKLFKTVVAVSMSAVMLAGGSLSAAASAPDDDVIMPRGSASYTKTLEKGVQYLLGRVPKSISNVAAKITMYNAISGDDLVTAFVKDERGLSVVSSEGARFKGTYTNTEKKMPYRSGLGIAEQEYRLNISLSNSSKSNSLNNISFSFIP